MASLPGSGRRELHWSTAPELSDEARRVGREATADEAHQDLDLTIEFVPRHRIEQGIGALKRFKRIPFRCEKTARNFRSIVSFAAGLCLIKFVHTA